GKGGVAVTVKDVPNVGEVKLANGVPADLASCHTALVAGYVVEGHVPADVMQKLLKEKPGVPGIAVARTPRGSPGESVEGHVPPDVMQKLLKEKPAVAGIAVAGMPMGSPGMEGNYSDRYNIVAFEKSGKQRVYASR